MTSQPILTVNKLNLSIGEQPLFSDISFSLKQGEMLAVMGPSGIGKSMLSKAIAGFLPESIKVNGGIVLNGLEVSQLHLMQRPNLQRAGMVFQDALKALNPLASVEQQLSLALTSKQLRLSIDNKNKVLALLEALGFAQAQTVLSKKPSQLSGGQRQRICIAMAMLGKANLIIADEPTSALDPITESEILQLIHRNVRQKSISGILITHDLSAALACDKLLVIADGGMVAYGSPIDAINHSSHTFCQQLAKLLP
ncbi:ATP-binding cassette domain-containing protein [Vibrio sp. TBV020]|uniref:ATP-binding cassette domain-containing protein n=1 Tax=Vibrio sp. TBV020 TaxID=3137398 RepID=UPI0038CDB9D5